MRRDVSALAALMVACIGCESLWQGTLMPDPRNCVNDPSVCGVDQECSPSLEVCVPQPQLAMATPPLGPSAGGPTIVLRGANLSSVSTVRFGATQVAGWQALSPTQLSVPLPPGAVGPVSISLETAEGLRAVRDDLFRYYPSTLDFGAPTDYPVALGPEGLVFADLDRDRHLDAVTASQSGALTILRGKGDGTFTELARPAISPGATRAVAEDLDGDGLLDLAVSNYGADRIELLFGRGDGTFRSGGPSYPMRAPVALAAVDLNGDGRRDLTAVGIYDNFVGVFLNLGSGMFAARQDSAVPNSCGLYDLAAGDLDKDGRLDLLVRCSSSDLAFALKGQGNGNLTPFPGAWPVGLSYYGIGFVALTDLNVDGQLDFVAPSPYENTVHVFLGGGNGWFMQAADVPAGVGPLGVTVADLNVDGHPDVAVGNVNGDAVHVLLNRGDGQFLPAAGFPAPGVKFVLAAGDLNEDGLPDIAASIAMEARFSILLNRSH